MFNSIRGSLLVWQAVILCLVVAGFGWTLYRQMRRAADGRIDSDLLGMAHSVAAALATSGDPARTAIPATYLSRFGKKEEDAPYFCVWDEEGNVVASSLAAEMMPEPPSPLEKKGKIKHSYYHRDQGLVREMILATDDGRLVLVGRSTHKERRELARLLAWSLGAGGGAIALGLIGGWLLSARVLAPIARMSQTAEQISATNLSQRIDAGSAKSELGRLARVLNATFDRLRAAFEQQRRFTADASHELRTPVTIVLAQVEQALAKERSPEEYRGALEACGRAAARMKSLVSGLLMLARADAGRWATHRSPAAFDEIISSTVALVRGRAAERQVTVNLQLQPLTAPVDAEQIGQIVMNLLSNAIQYNRPGGSVFVTLGKDGDAAVLRVADTGPGIAAEHQPHVFDRFYRVDPARTSDRGGCGLGLAICREIVLAHGGSIELESAPGQGAVFTVRLPLAPAEATTTNLADRAEPPVGGAATESAHPALGR